MPMTTDQRATIIEALRGMVSTPLPERHDDLTPELAIKIINKYREALSICVLLLDDEKKTH